MEDITNTPLANRRAHRTRRLPARFIIDHVGTLDEGGLALQSILQSDDEELEIECEPGDFPKLAQRFINAEVVYAALTDPRPK